MGYNFCRMHGKWSRIKPNFIIDMAPNNFSRIWQTDGSNDARSYPPPQLYHGHVVLGVQILSWTVLWMNENPSDFPPVLVCKRSTWMCAKGKIMNLVAVAKKQDRKSTRSAKLIQAFFGVLLFCCWEEHCITVLYNIVQYCTVQYCCWQASIVCIFNNTCEC